MPAYPALVYSNGRHDTVAPTDTIVGTVSYNAQTLTLAQRTQAQANLGVAPYAYVVNPTSPYTAASGEDVWCSTASAAQTVTLPASPTNGVVIGAMRNGANTLTVAANGKTIAGTAADLVINKDKSGVWCRWDATTATWQLETRTRA